MIGYITLGTNDKDKAFAFYDALFGEMGAKRADINDRLSSYSTGQGAPILVGTPWDEKTASFGNGTMVAIPVGSTENVDRLHAFALTLGASDEGAPGERIKGFYGGYFRDMDGNKFVFFHMG